MNGLNDDDEDLHDDGTELLGTFDIKVTNMFIRGHLFAGLVFIKSWLECWKPAELSLCSKHFCAVREQRITGRHGSACCAGYLQKVCLELEK